MKKLSIIFFMMITFLCVEASEFQVVANRKVEVDRITFQDLREIYLGQRIFWDTDRRIEPVYLNHGDPASSDFFKTVLSESPYGFQSYWRRKLFAGGGTPPKKFNVFEDLISFISVNPGALGIIPKDRKIVSDRVKIISIDR